MTSRVARLFLFGIIFVAPSADATELVIQKWVSVSCSLTGQVIVPGTEEPARGVTVELCNAGWKEVLASTKTDSEGRFSLEQVRKSKLIYLRVRAPGMDICQLRVRIDKRAAAELHIYLSVAT